MKEQKPQIPPKAREAFLNQQPIKVTKEPVMTDQKTTNSANSKRGVSVPMRKIVIRTHKQLQAQLKKINLPDHLLAALLAIADFSRYKKEIDAFVCIPSQKTLAAKLGCDPKTVYNRIQSLKELGLLITKGRSRVSGETGGVRRTTNEHIIPVEAVRLAVRRAKLSKEKLHRAPRADKTGIRLSPKQRNAAEQIIAQAEKEMRAKNPNLELPDDFREEMMTALRRFAEVLTTGKTDFTDFPSGGSNGNQSELPIAPAEDTSYRTDKKNEQLDLDASEFDKNLNDEIAKIDEIEPDPKTEPAQPIEPMMDQDLFSMNEERQQQAVQALVQEGLAAKEPVGELTNRITNALKCQFKQAESAMTATIEAVESASQSRIAKIFTAAKNAVETTVGNAKAALTKRANKPVKPRDMFANETPEQTLERLKNIPMFASKQAAWDNRQNRYFDRNKGMLFKHSSYAHDPRNAIGYVGEGASQALYLGTINALENQIRQSSGTLAWIGDAEDLVY